MIILVPEITLTPQTIQRFRAVLGDVIAVIHSHMSDGEGATVYRNWLLAIRRWS